MIYVCLGCCFKTWMIFHSVCSFVRSSFKATSFFLFLLLLLLLHFLSFILWMSQKIDFSCCYRWRKNIQNWRQSIEVRERAREIDDDAFGAQLISLISPSVRLNDHIFWRRQDKILHYFFAPTLWSKKVKIGLFLCLSFFIFTLILTTETPAVICCCLCLKNHIYYYNVYFWLVKYYFIQCKC